MTESPRPHTMRALLARLRRAGVLVTLVDGRVKVDGWRKLSPSERAQLRDEKARLVQWLEARELRRQRRAERKRTAPQQAVATAQQQRERKVIGQVVTRPGQPVKLLYADECREIPAQRARVLGKATLYGRRTFS